MKQAHVLHIPWTGLGNFGGFRGNNWYKNRIQVFKQFVVPSLLAQTDQDFILWCGFRYEEKSSPLTWEIKKIIDDAGLRSVFTFGGVAIWDDKHSDEVAKERLVNAVHVGMGDLINALGDAEEIIWTLQPSDDLYHYQAVQGIKAVFAKHPELQAVGFTKGYVCDYKTLEVREWNPETNPPFYSIKFDRETFVDPLKHVNYAAHKSHEYVMDKLKYGKMNDRGFLVGIHGQNISTTFNHPYTGAVCENVLENFGLKNTQPLVIPLSIRKHLFKRLPFKAQKKLRYWAGEKKWVLQPLFRWIYDVARS